MQFGDMTAAVAAAARDFAAAAGATAPAAAAAALARHLVQAFALPAPDAPGLHFVGARLHADGLAPLSVGGTGLDQAQAVASCLGEAFERLSQVDDGAFALRRGAAPAVPGELAQWVREHALDAAAPAGAIDWIAGCGLADGAPAEIPADFCLRRPPAAVRHGADFPLSIGAAAGADSARAREAAVLELIERDAASLWWIAGAPAAPLPAAVQRGAGETLAALRGPAAARRTWLLDITSDIAVPCVAALSSDPDGRGLACGLAARRGMAQAARAALLELAQMELALRLTQAKAAAAAAALNPAERGQLMRAQIETADVPHLHPQRQGPAAPADSADPLAVLAARGIAAYGFDLTRPHFGVPVVRVVAPALQLMPCRHRGERLTAALARYPHTGGFRRELPLL